MTCKVNFYKTLKDSGTVLDNVFKVTFSHVLLCFLYFTVKSYDNKGKKNYNVFNSQTSVSRTEVVSATKYQSCN